MWHSNKSVIRTHCRNGSRLAWAFFDGISGWQRVRPTSTDSVSNIMQILSCAKANGRKVDVYIKDNHIEAATLR